MLDVHIGDYSISTTLWRFHKSWEPSKIFCSSTEKSLHFHSLVQCFMRHYLLSNIKHHNQNQGLVASSGIQTIRY
jgi:hypothetical protein